MSRLEWDQLSDRQYETGIDHGVLYLESQSGIVWNGLLSVEQKSTSSAQSYFFEGEKIAITTTEDSFSGKVQAITFPEEFLPYDGFSLVNDGLMRGNQSKKTFGLSFRTLIMNDFTGEQDGYKIHILYNLLAIPEDVSRNTIDSNIDPIFFAWDVTSRPPHIDEYKPSSYIIADSRHLSDTRLTRLEDTLYGTIGSEPYLPPLDTLLEILDSNFTIIITDNGDGTWTANAPDEYITMLDSTTFQITDVDATYLDADTYEVSST
jgi:hypothetical protein